MVLVPMLDSVCDSMINSDCDSGVTEVYESENQK